jgi:Rad3-related DNA helicase
VFDEAHNVEKMCEESASIELKSLDITLCIDEVTQVIARDFVQFICIQFLINNFSII